MFTNMYNCIARLVKRPLGVSSLDKVYCTLMGRAASTNPDLEQRRVQMMAKSLPKRKAIPGVKHIVLVASGKGGVGKSTTAVNLATAMAVLHPKMEIGLLDADVFGPSIPLMMGLHDSPNSDKDNLMVPLTNYGVKCMSLGFLVHEESAVIWRGLMVMGALDKLLRQVAWGSLDCLVVDTPPGTGDTHLSLIQNVPIAGVVLVTTSQVAALQVARRGVSMLRKLGVPIVGVVQNMSTIVCSKCRHSTVVFGNSTHDFAAELGIEFLQDIPLSQEITTSSDKGQPLVISKPDCPQTSAYKELAMKVVTFLEDQAKQKLSHGKT